MYLVNERLSSIKHDLYFFLKSENNGYLVQNTTCMIIQVYVKSAMLFRIRTKTTYYCK